MAVNCNEPRFNVEWGQFRDGGAPIISGQSPAPYEVDGVPVKCARCGGTMSEGIYVRGERNYYYHRECAANTLHDFPGAFASDVVDRVRREASEMIDKLGHENARLKAEVARLSYLEAGVWAALSGADADADAD